MDDIWKQIRNTEDISDYKEESEILKHSIMDHQREEANSLSSLSISTVRLLAATISLYSGSASTGPETESKHTKNNNNSMVTQSRHGVQMKCVYRVKQRNEWKLIVRRALNNNNNTHPLSSYAASQYIQKFCLLSLKTVKHTRVTLGRTEQTFYC